MDLIPCISSCFSCEANLNAENKDHITPLLMAAQNQCTDAFQSLMNHMDQPFEGIFKIVDLMVDHTQILTVSFGKLYSYFMETSLI